MTDTGTQDEERNDRTIQPENSSVPKKGKLKKCAVCPNQFIGTAKARYCSQACRSKAARIRSKV